MTYYQKNAPKKIPKLAAADSESESDSEDETPAPVKNGKVTNGKAVVANGNGKKKESSDDDDSSEDEKPAVKAPVKTAPKAVPAKKQSSDDSDDSSEEEAPKKTPVNSTSFLTLTTKNNSTLILGKETSSTSQSTYCQESRKQ